MIEETWKITKKELEYDIDGKERLSKATMESSFKFYNIDKDRWTFSFQAISSIGIPIAFMGLILTMWAQCNQNKIQTQQKKSIFEFSIYVKAIKDMGVVANHDPNDSAFHNGKSEIFDEIIPEIQLLNNESLIKRMDTFRTALYNYAFFNELKDTLDSVIIMRIKLNNYIIGVKKKEFKQETINSLFLVSLRHANDRHYNYIYNVINLWHKDSLDLSDEFKKISTIFDSLPQDVSNDIKTLQKNIDENRQDVYTITNFGINENSVGGFNAVNYSDEHRDSRNLESWSDFTRCDSICLIRIDSLRNQIIKEMQKNRLVKSD